MDIVEDDEDRRGRLSCLDAERERARADGQGIGLAVLERERRRKGTGLGSRDVRKQVDERPGRLVEGRERELGLGFEPGGRE